MIHSGMPKNQARVPGKNGMLSFQDENSVQKLQQGWAASGLEWVSVFQLWLSTAGATSYALASVKISQRTTASQAAIARHMRRTHLTPGWKAHMM